MNIFTPTEHAILCDYFGIARPEAYLTVNIEFPPEGDGIFVEPPDDTYVVDTTPLRNAVARIALGVIQDRLPQCGVFDGEGELTLTRQAFERPARDVVMLPQHLFTINWADSAPGISWPETYHSAYIPGFDRYVVTAAVDGKDLYGVTELAIGFFDGARLPVEGSAEVIKEWWRYLCDNCQDRWAYVWDEGLITKELAVEWADEVWSTESDSFADDELEDQLGVAVDPLLPATEETSEGSQIDALDRKHELAQDVKCQQQCEIKAREIDEIISAIRCNQVSDEQLGRLIELDGMTALVEGTSDTSAKVAATIKQKIIDDLIRHLIYPLPHAQGSSISAARRQKRIAQYITLTGDQSISNDTTKQAIKEWLVGHSYLKV